MTRTASRERANVRSPNTEDSRETRSPPAMMEGATDPACEMNSSAEISPMRVPPAPSARAIAPLVWIFRSAAFLF